MNDIDETIAELQRARAAIRTNLAAAFEAVGGYDPIAADPTVTSQKLIEMLSEIADQYGDPIRGEPPVAAIREYAFDVTLKAAIRVKATTEVEARRTLYFHLGSTNANFGAWPDGEPILAEVSLDHIDRLYEIDGEAV